MPDANDPGLLTPAEISLLIDRYEITMAASYHRLGRNEPAVFEHFVRKLPPHRDWLVVCGLGPTLRLISEMRFGPAELGYLGTLGCNDDFLGYLEGFRFSGDIDAMPEGTIAFPDEPFVRVTAPLIDAQLLETLLLNQINFQTMIATKAARVVLAADGKGDSVIDFSPRRDHGVDAAMKVARASAVAGFGGTSNMAAAMRYGLLPVGTMAHSYVLSFESEEEAFEAFMRENPENALLLVDTYDTLEGVRRAIEASRRTEIPLTGIRIDSGDLAGLAHAARGLLDDAGFKEAVIVASGDLEEHRIAEMCRAGTPIDLWGVGTELGTSRDSPVVNGVYKLVAELRGGAWRGVAKRSEGKVTLPGAKQVFRRLVEGTMVEDVVGTAEEEIDGEPLLIPAMREGEIVHAETLDQMRERAKRSLGSLPVALRSPGEKPRYPVRHSEALTEAARALTPG
ncbi:MAG TPA: nicotinate phosphoribosyltransferase [Solirubrobacterales bacterium]|nr:nicotinate phosphoribosyltransferase [Solirubrobacterales bacterium]